MHRRFFLTTWALGACQWCMSSANEVSAWQEPALQSKEKPNLESQDYSWIFKGENLDEWMTLEGTPVTSGWQAKNGEISLKRSLIKSGHIVTKKEFGDFELSFDWKIAKGGNSGLKYRVRKYGDRSLGCEYQIYDPNGKQVEAKNKTASLYDLYEPDSSIEMLPAGQWNSAKISVRDQRIEHWLNGHLVVKATVGDEQWIERIAQSKFNDAEGFGKNPCGRIMLTDHGSDVFYRNFQFKLFATKC